jgi:hypothetical protein
MKGCRPLEDSEVDEALASFWGQYRLRDRRSSCSVSRAAFVSPSS